MRIFVCIKQILDTSLPLLPIDSSQRGIPTEVIQQDETHVKLIPNPADCAALEEAMHLKQQFSAEVIAITFGSTRAQEVLKYCLGRGVDRAIHLQYPNEWDLCSPPYLPDSWTTSFYLSQEIRKNPFDLIFCGEKSLDGCGAQVGPMVAELLNVPQITRTINLFFQPDSLSFIAHRLLERGNRQVVTAPIPILISFSSYIIQPLYVSINKYKQVDSDRIETQTVPSTSISRNKILEVNYPKPRPRKISAPQTTMSASERMKFMLAGGRPKNQDQTTKTESIIEDTPEMAADHIIGYLKENGFI